MKYLALSILALSSCAASTVYRQPGAPSLSPSMPAEVRVYSGEPKGAYVILGSVAADRLGGADDAVELLREKAASLGANAVIGVRLTKIDLASGRTGLSGTAVRLGR
ncbi:MAG: heavy metal-binding domain-containing protein [Proteobacteria bacterium]|nr:MAG: heavy metal-binding domain-containing protein [Pseudomonadota bacterium]